jgi:hypothetical protein
MFTPAQYARLNDLRRRAWSCECARSGTPLNARPAEDRWYRSVLFEALHVRTSKGCNHAMDFDLVMLAFAQIANDDREIGYWSTAATRRFCYLCRQRLAKLGRINRTTYDWSYIRGTMSQMHLPERMEDVPPELMRNVLIALDTHCRRRAEAVAVVEDGLRCDVHDGHASRGWSEGMRELPL